MKLHWKILIWMAAGVLAGLCMQGFLAAPGWLGASLTDHEDGGVRIESVVPGAPAAKAKLGAGDRVHAIILNRGQEQREEIRWIHSASELEETIEGLSQGTIVWLDVEGATQPQVVSLAMKPGSPRDTWLEPFRFVAVIFMSLLKMLIIPLVLTSIITGVAGLGGGRDFGRLGGKTFLYYVSTSLLAAALGLLLVNLIQPGVGAQLGLDPSQEFSAQDESLAGIFKRMVPQNVFSAFSDNQLMLQVIFFSLLFGYCITRVPERERRLLTDFFSAAFKAMMKLAQLVLSLVPYGVFCLVIKVVAEAGISAFKPLALYMLMVFIGLLVHAGVTLPVILRLAGKVSPLRWVRAMSPALLTAFSTSSSSATLPVTLESVEKRGGVSNKVTSFVLPLGATVNMDGTALYECAGVLFLAQYYASAGGDPLTFQTQIKVVILALLASIGAAGIPSAGLVMMLAILSALRLPIEGAALLLAIDRPLDMCRTVVNVWSDSCGTAVIASTEGEVLLQEEGIDPAVATEPSRGPPEG
ncbi:MAG: cation:dicarboxylate symporter family transporter [Planctomycetota bacterium]